MGEPTTSEARAGPLAPGAHRAPAGGDVCRGVVLAAAVVVAYLPALRAGFVWDDNIYITTNPNLRDLRGLWNTWLEPTSMVQYYPLFHTAFWVEHRLWGDDPFGYHLVNVLLHAASSVLLWRLLRRLAVPGAFLAAGLFALHPVMVESVAWATERKNTLSAFFYLLAVHAWLWFDPLPDGPPEGKPRWSRYAVTLACVLAALASKTVTCTLPAALLLLVWWKRGRIAGRDLVRVAPMLVLALGLGALAATMETRHAGAEGREWAMSAAERLLVAGRGVWFYAGKLAWPAKLTFIYPRWEVSAAVWWQWLYPLAALAMVAALWAARRRLGRGALVGVLFFIGTLAPLLGFFDAYVFRFSFVADHFQYHAAPGLLALAAAAVARAGAAVAAGRGRVARVVPAALAFVLVTTLGALTWRQARIYRDQETLWRDTLAKNPSCWMAMSNLANVLLARGEQAEALDLLERSVRVNPADAELQNNLAAALAGRGEYARALPYYQRAVVLAPDFAEAYSNLCNALTRLGRPADAVPQCTRAVALDPNLAIAYYNRGLAHQVLGDLDDGIADYGSAIARAPDGDWPEALNNRGGAYAQLGRLDRALADYDRAIAARPGYVSALLNRGQVYARLGRYDRALADYDRAVDLDPTSAAAYARRASAHLALGRADRARADARRSRELGGALEPGLLRLLDDAAGH